MSLRAQDDEQLRARLVEMITASAAEAGVDPAETVDDFLRAVDDRTQEIGRQLVGELLAEILKQEGGTR